MPEVETVKVNTPILPLCLWLLAGIGCASARAQAVTAHSVSQQFTARQLQRAAFSRSRPSQIPVAGGLAYVVSSRALPALGNNDEVGLEPSTLVVSCERVKALVLNKLGLTDRWEGRIDLIINPQLPETNAPQLTATRWNRGWTYQMELPRSVQEELLLRSIIQALLLEIANRQAGVQSADVPLWQVEGMGAELQANNFPTFIVQPGQNWSANVVWNKGAEMMPKELRLHQPLSFQQLSWPEASDLTPEGLPLYRSCAQLFLQELLRFNDGRACLRSMVMQLPHYWNWQTAFLTAFHSHFDQLLDVEKWWGVSFVDFTKDYKVQTWSAVDCRRKLQDSLDIPVDVHFGAGQMPAPARMTLQEVIRQWPAQDSFNAVQRAMQGLRFLVPRATPEIRTLTESYLKTLGDYLNSSRKAGVVQQLGLHAPSLLHIAQADAIQRLDALDRQRETIWTNSVPPSPPQLSAAGQPEAKAGH
ncbi:MAG TPA: hypothetical protein VK731_10800 [Candidatus Cybelea sp.]|nr:hypothetical protein [Candidatus Cybelea sp.]